MLLLSTYLSLDLHVTIDSYAKRWLMFMLTIYGLVVVSKLAKQKQSVCVCFDNIIQGSDTTMPSFCVLLIGSSFDRYYIKNYNSISRRNTTATRNQLQLKFAGGSHFISSEM